MGVWAGVWCSCRNTNHVKTVADMFRSGTTWGSQYRRPPVRAPQIA